MEAEAPTIAAIVAIVGAIGSCLAILTFWMRFSDRITKSEIISENAIQIAAEAKKDAHEVNQSLAIQTAAFGLYREKVASEYIHREVMREVEDRLTAAIDRLGERFDRLLEEAVGYLMAQAPLSDELALEAVAAFRQFGEKSKAADSLGITRNTYCSRLKVAAQRGMMLDTPAAMPGYRIAQVTNTPKGDFIQQKPEHGETFAVPAGHMVKGVSALVDPDGREIIKWVKTKQGELDPLRIAEWLKNAFVDIPAAKPIPAPALTATSLLTLLPCNDWHLNLHTWGRQVGQSWDLKIAEQTIGSAVLDTISRTMPSAECIILGGGDLLHTNGRKNETANGTPQDVDGRYEKAVETLGRLMVQVGDSALRKHNHVTFRFLKGNHDEDPSVAIAYFIKAWYRNEPRVTVDVDPSEYFWFRFGRVMLGATHGHQSSNHIAKMPGIMAHRRAEDWGATRFRYVHGFHLHHSAKFATEGQGVISEIHQAPIPQDAWHFGSGFLSGRSLQAITYHKNLGEIGRVRTAILDAECVPENG